MLTEKEVSSLAKIRSQIIDANSNIAECSDLWLSDIRRLANIPWQLDAIIRDNTPKKVSSWKELKPESKVEDEPSGWEEN